MKGRSCAIQLCSFVPAYSCWTFSLPWTFCLSLDIWDLEMINFGPIKADGIWAFGIFTNKCLPFHNIPKSTFFLLLFFLFVGTVHLAISSDINDKLTSGFKISCKYSNGADKCLVIFPDGKKAKLFYFLEKRDGNLGLGHYFCVCPNLQNGEEKQHQQICMLDRDQVQAEFVGDPDNIRGILWKLAKWVDQMHPFSAIYEEKDKNKKLRAITYSHTWGNDLAAGFLIWHPPNGGGCTAMATYPRDQSSMETVLNNLDRKNWQLKATSIHACPVVKGGGNFGCAAPQLFIINHDENIVLMSKPEMHTNYDGTTYYEEERRFWMWNEKKEEKTIFNYAPWTREQISHKSPNFEEFQDFIISSKDMTEVEPHKCIYERDFVQIQPFGSLKESMKTTHDIVQNPLSEDGQESMKTAHDFVTNSLSANEKESMKTAHDSVPNQPFSGFKHLMGTAKNQFHDVSNKIAEKVKNYELNAASQNLANTVKNNKEKIAVGILCTVSYVAGCVATGHHG